MMTGERMDTRLITEEDLSYTVKKVQEGEVIAFPTETVFGLGVRYDSEAAFHKLVCVKNRPDHKPFTVMCANAAQIEQIAYCDEKVKHVMHSFMPGPLTLLLPAKHLANYITDGTGVVGVRIPNHTVALKLLEQTGPMLVPSANKSNKPPCTSTKEVWNVFQGEIPAIIDGKCMENGIPSTILDCTKSPFVIVRQGAITLQEIEEVL